MPSFLGHPRFLALLKAPSEPDKDDVEDDIQEESTSLSGWDSQVPIPGKPSRGLSESSRGNVFAAASKARHEKTDAAYKRSAIQSLHSFTLN